jgi:hypothetical protein
VRRTSLATAVLLAVTDPLAALASRFRRRTVMRLLPTPPRPVTRVAEVLLLCGLFTGLAYADYNYYALAVPTTAQIHAAPAASALRRIPPPVRSEIEV